MASPDPLSAGGTRPLDVGRTDEARPEPRGAGGPSAAESPAFLALLERLEDRARELVSGSRTVDGPEPLRDAVNQAGGALEDALDLGDRLLEAYRESVQRGTAGEDE